MTFGFYVLWGLLTSLVGLGLYHIGFMQGEFFAVEELTDLDEDEDEW